MSCVLHHGDCRDVLKTFPDCSVDSIVTDPPYELGFMGKSWDASGIAYNVELWREMLRVLKPGGHLLAFGGTRTYHRMAVAIEDAGFEIRDSIHWIYGSGFPKSLDVSKAIDKQAGAERERVPATGGLHSNSNLNDDNWKNIGSQHPTQASDVPATDEAKQWSGWGTALKPAHEPIVVARKPLDGTVATNVLKHGTGALNIDGCRVGSEVRHNPPCATKDGSPSLGGGWTATEGTTASGRWPANIVFTHADGCQQTGISDDIFGGGAKASGGFVDGYKSGDGFVGQSVTVPVWACVPGCPVAALDEQQDGASRFFTVTEWFEIDVPFRYVAKPRKTERNAGLDGLPTVVAGSMAGGAETRPDKGNTRSPRQNHHPTVKPVTLMRWLVRLITPPGGTVLDPFAGSGTTLVAATLEGFHSIGIEMTAEYLPIIEGRVAWAESQPKPEPQPTQEELF